MYPLWENLNTLKACRWVELSHSMNNDSPYWAGIPDGSVELGKVVFDWGNPMLDCLIQTFLFPGQFGTHIDFPGHFVKDGALSDSYGAQQMMYPLCVIDISDKVAEDVHYAATAADIQAYEAQYGPIPDGAFVALRTDWYKRWPDMNAFANLDENGGEDIEIVAKIENQAGVDNVMEICENCGGIMIARGDLGVEIPFVEVPAVQKRLTRICRMMGKRVITATEMLESMIQNPRPTRAEISDVANAVYEGTTCIMLSGESAAGKYPVEAVKTMAEIAEYTEKHTDYTSRFRATEYVGKDNLDCISHAVCSMALDVKAKAIVVCSVSGKTAMLVSRFRTPVNIIGLTTNVKIWRRLSMSWGVTPVMAEQFPSMEVLFYYAKKETARVLDLHPGDNILLTGGVTGRSGNTDTIKIETI